MNLQIMTGAQRIAGMRSFKDRRKTALARNASTILVSRLARKAHAITLSSTQLNMPISALNVQLLKGLLLNVLGKYTSAPECLDVTAITPTDDLIIYKLKCHAADYPKINGSLGKSLKALKTLFAALGRASGARIDVVLGSTERINEPYFAPRTGPFDPEPIRQTIEAIMAVLYEEVPEVTTQTTDDVTCYTVTMPRLMDTDVNDALNYLVELFGAKEDHKLYIAFR